MPQVKRLDCQKSPPVPDENQNILLEYATDMCITQQGEIELIVATSSKGVRAYSLDAKWEIDFNHAVTSRCITANRIGNVFVIDHSDERIHRFNLNSPDAYVGVLLKAGDHGLGKPVMIRWFSSVSSLVVAHVIKEKIYISMVHVD